MTVGGEVPDIPGGLPPGAESSALPDPTQFGPALRTPQERAAEAAERQARLGAVLTNLAAHPVLGGKVTEIIRAGDVGTDRSLGRTLLIEYEHLQASRRGQPDLDGQRPIATMLRRMTQRMPVHMISGQLVNEGLIAQRQDVVALWEQLAAQLGGFVREDSNTVRALEEVRFEVGFGVQPPEILLGALLRINSSTASVWDQAVRRIMTTDQPPFDGTPYRRALVGLRSMVSEVYRPLRATTAHDSPEDVTLAHQVAVLQRLFAEQPMGVSAYADLLRDRRLAAIDVPRAVQQGLFAMLRHFVLGSARSFDVRKVMSAVGLSTAMVAPALLRRRGAASPQEIQSVANLISPIPASRWLRVGEGESRRAAVGAARLLLDALNGEGGERPPTEAIESSLGIVGNTLTGPQHRAARILLGIIDVGPLSTPRFNMTAQALRAKLRAIIEEEANQEGR